MTRKPTYHDIILRYMPEGYDTRHVEAFMRGEFSTLDHLTPSRFRAEVRKAIACIDEGGKVFAEQIARSYGL